MGFYIQNNKKLNLVSACACAALVNGSAWAQTSVDEIIVTATKRAERLVDVPISMNAFSDIALDQLAPEDLSDLTGFAGNVYMPPIGEAGRSTITIRGIGAGVNKTAGKSVGVYVDGVYVSADTALDMDMFNLASVEILKGPQGTLFGRDTIGGAILLTTAAPKGEFGGKLHATLGNLGQRTFAGTMDIPLHQDQLVLRLNARHHHQDGYIHNSYDNTDLGEQNHNAFGASLYLAPTSNWDAHLVYQYSQKDDHPNAAGESTTNLGSDLIPYTINQNRGESQTQEAHRASLNARYRMENGYSLNFVTGASSLRDMYIQDGDRLPDDVTVQRFDNETREFSQEIRLSSPLWDKGDFLAGLYYLDSDNRYSPTFPLMGESFLNNVFFLPPELHPRDQLDGQVIKTRSKTYAGFIHGNYHLNDDLTFFGGARLTHDKKAIDYHEFGEVFALFGLPELRHKTKTKNTPLSWTVGAKYSFAKDVNTYASISRGYRSVSVKDDFISQADIDAAGDTGDGFFTKPEFVTNYELGTKGIWANGRVRASGSVFYMDYTDIQVSISDPDFSFLRALTNAAKASVKGLELDGEIEPIEDLVLGASFGYLKTRYDEFTPDPGDDRAGKGFGNAPKWSVGASLDYSHSAGQGDIDWHLDYTNQKAPDDFVFDQVAFVGDYALVNGAVSYHPDAQNWRIKAWVRNAFDVNDPKTNFHWGAGLGPLLDNVTVQYERPRTYGVSFDYDF